MTLPTPASEPQNTHPMVTRSKVGIFKLKIYLSEAGVSSDVPKNIHAAMAYPLWQQAIRVGWMLLSVTILGLYALFRLIDEPLAASGC